MYVVHVVGAGGTGSYFLKEFCRFAAGMDNVKIIIYDGDIVEEKNLERQCFMKEDVGRNKAAVMAEVLNEAFGIPCSAMCSYLTKASQFAEMNSLDKMILAGCVDNHAARLVMEKYFLSCARKGQQAAYFDAANEFSTGEIVYAYSAGGKVIGQVRSAYFPEMNNPGKARTEMSCTELNAVLPQHIATNMLAANQLLSAACNYMGGIYHPGVSFFNRERFSSDFMPFHSTKQSTTRHLAPDSA